MATFQTLDQMTATIAADMTRTTLNAQIQEAILASIRETEIQRFWFNEVNGASFTTVAGTADYDLSSGSLLGVAIYDFIELDWARITINGRPRLLYRRGDSDQLDEDIAYNTLNGEPTEFGIYAGKLRLYPIPQDAYTVSLAGHYKAALLDSGDKGSGNPWMTYGQGNEIIRRQATARVYVTPLKAFDLAQQFTAMAGTAIEVAKIETSKRKRTGRIRPLRGSF